MIVRAVPGWPDLLGVHRAQPGRYPFLLESVARSSVGTRYDILFAFPGTSLYLRADGTLGGQVALKGNDFLQNLDRWWADEYQEPLDGTDLPFRGGWFLYLGYELAGQVEPVLGSQTPASLLPIAQATRIPAAVIRDHARQTTFLVAEQEAQLEMMLADVSAPAPAAEDRVGLAALYEDDAQSFISGVERILEYIRAGDVFQVNLSRAWRARLLDGSNYCTLYRRLRQHNPAPYSGLAHLGRGVLLSSSPERLVRVTGDVVETRPIAGTRPRSEHTAQDQALSHALLAHPKERAEHVMLIDLERNDLGRVCVPGTMEVNELMVLESYAHVHHIVSNVRGRLRPGTPPGEVIRAVFPGGTITGCPKVRCMEIIAELEGTSRGPYTGSMGYLNRNGDMDLNILIRTMLVEGGQVSLRAGAGIVADSEPLRELEETRAKARGLLLALSS